MPDWRPVEQKENYCRWVLPLAAWTKAQPVGGGHIKILFDSGEWLAAADLSDLSDEYRFLSSAEIESVRSEFGLDRYCGGLTA